jgi:hypothetical protein
MRALACLLLSTLLLDPLLQAQWQTVTTGLPTGVSAAKLHVVDNNVIWGAGRRPG